MRDPRIDEYARLLVDRSVGVQPGWQVQVRATPLARPLVEAVLEQIARRGAYPLLQMTFETIGGPFAREAPLETLRVAAPLQRRIWEEADAFIAIWAPENTREGSELSEERKAALQQASTPMRERTMAMSAPWVIAEYPVLSGAQDAGMTLPEYEQFIFDSVLLDWNAEGERMRKIADVFDAAEEVRIVGPGTDLTLSLAGRTGAVDDGHVNMPGGEVFYSPVEDSAEGVIEFSEFPATYQGGAFIAFHGSWNRAPGPQQGYNVVFVPFAGGKPVDPAKYEIFADGFAGAVKQPDRAAHRPTGVAQGPDGAIYIADDQGGRIWKVTYKGTGK